MAHHYPVTRAIHVLRQHQVDFEPKFYKYEPRGGTRVSARELGVPEHEVIKTLILEDEKKQPLCVLMHGDCEISMKSMARQLGKKTVSPCAPAVADRHSGYQVGGTSPFGLKRPLPIFVEKSILNLERIYINGGARGFLVALHPQELVRVLQAVEVEVAIPG